MSAFSSEPNRQQAMAGLRARLQRLGLSDYDAWINYLRCGGNAAYLEFEAYLHGALIMPGYDQAALQHSIWEAETF
jgi:hypothetical protein